MLYNGTVAIYGGALKYARALYILLLPPHSYVLFMELFANGNLVTSDGLLLITAPGVFFITPLKNKQASPFEVSDALRPFILLYWMPSIAVSYLLVVLARVCFLSTNRHC